MHKKKDKNSEINKIRFLKIKIKNRKSNSNHLITLPQKLIRRKGLKKKQ